MSDEPRTAREPLTDEELEDMEGYQDIDIRSRAARAAAEMSPLRAALKKAQEYNLKLKVIMEDSPLSELEAENEKLKKYVQHKADCLVYNRAGLYSCNCGLDGLLKGGDDG